MEMFFVDVQVGVVVILCNVNDYLVTRFMYNK